MLNLSDAIELFRQFHSRLKSSLFTRGGVLTITDLTVSQAKQIALLVSLHGSLNRCYVLLESCG